MVKVWLNHWFSTAYNIIQLIKHDNPDYLIIGTNVSEKAVLSKVCDEWYVEPSLRGDEYVEYCLSFCEQHDVNVFMPRKEMVSISRRKEEFERIGVKVMVDDYAMVSILNQKEQAYQMLAEHGVKTIPDYYVVTNVEEFETAYAKLCGDYKQICFKFVHDEGGKSFRLIDNERKGYESLFKKQSTRMPLESVVLALSEREQFPPIMVMPYLPGEEISVDCLNTERGLIMLPRIKDATRIERFSYDEDILKITREIYSVVRLECPCNIQFKNLGGVPYFLEVNTRMSGGVQMGCAAGNVNIPSIAVNKLLGINQDWELNKKDAFVSHIETPLVLQ